MISVLYLAQNMKFKVSTMYQTSKHIILHVFLNFPWIFFFFYPKRFASRGGASAAVNLWMHFLIWCEIRIISVDMPRLCVNMPIFRIFPLFFFLFFLPTFVHSRWYECTVCIILIFACVYIYCVCEHKTFFITMIWLFKGTYMYKPRPIIHIILSWVPKEIEQEL